MAIETEQSKRETCGQSFNKVVRTRSMPTTVSTKIIIVASLHSTADRRLATIKILVDGRSCVEHFVIRLLVEVGLLFRTCCR